VRPVFADQAWEDYLYWQKHDRNILERVNALHKESTHAVYGDRKAGAT
jgi:toxin YoeB